MTDTSTNISRGSITFDGSDLIVRFSYNKRRFADIKRIREARYDKSAKCWRVPVTRLETLSNFKSFSAGLIAYNFDAEAVQTLALQVTAARNKSVERILKNPFFVAEQDIAAAAVSIVFRMNRAPAGLRAELPRYSRVKNLLESIPEVQYIKRTGQFFFPVEKLTDFIRVLRDKNILFAVEESAGIRLKETASLRQAIIENDRQPLEQELGNALLVPYIRSALNVETGQQQFTLCEYTTEQLKLLMPDETNFTERKRTALGFDEPLLLKLLAAARTANFRIWLDRNVISFLHEREHIYRAQFKQRETFPEALLAVVMPECFWCLDSAGKGLLSIHNQIFLSSYTDQLRKVIAGTAQITVPWTQEHRVFRFKDTQLTSAVQLLDDIAPELEIQVCRSDRFDQLYTEVKKRAALRQRQQYYLSLSDAELPTLEPERAIRLFPHQRVATRWLLEVSSGLLGDDMGLGKTLTILTAFHLRYLKGDVKKCIVICPQSLVGNWEREVLQWFPEYQISVLAKQKKLQQTQLLDFARAGSLQGLIINFESFRLERIVSRLIQAAQVQPCMLIVDESQRVKNPASKSFMALAGLSRFTPYRYLLSGTPTPRDIADIWAQMFVLDGGKRFGRNFYEWLETVAELGNTWSDVAVNKFLPDAVEETVARVQEVLLRRRKEAVIDLPEKLFVTRMVPLKGEQKKRFQEVRDQLLLRVSDLRGDEGYREIQSVLEEYLRAVQVASNPRLVDPLWKGDPVKFVELDSIIDEVVGAQSGKIVIWTNYLVNVAELTDRYKKYGVVALTGAVPAHERSGLIESFQNLESDSPKIFIAIPAAGGVGITLTAAQTVVYLDKTWNAEQYLQSIDRVHRIGQSGTVTIINLHSTAVDTLIARNLKKKEDNQKALLGDNALMLDEVVPDRAELLEALYD